MTNMNYIFYVIWHHSWEQARPNVPVKKQGQACFIQNLLVGIPFTPVTSWSRVSALAVAADKFVDKTEAKLAS